ncbi:leucine-rich repeat domain-containing protein [Zobellia uliginosa]|uniref:leucine-rich repeat domain-containing protein n=1 Tax=Zobellia uliginosa TaxID=143224 RepID=UPI0026E3EAF6|nr:hypothetical protein [Zobellia uliginosa]MDO6518097.1 hypothetical protein [Zobellia uliginosa]
MKTIQSVLKVNIKASIIMLLLFMLGLTNCKKDDDPVTQSTVTSTSGEEEIILSDEKEITEFKFLATDNIVLALDVRATIDINAKTIIANLPSDIPLTALTPKITISKKAVISPIGEKDFTDSVTYTVTAEDGTTQNYSVTATSNSSDKEITQFRFTGIENNGVTTDIPGIIDEEGKAITIDMPNGTEITALEPELEIPDNATYEPTGPQDFTSPINYTVTAEDGTSRTYLVTVDVLLGQKEILLLISELNSSNTLNWNESDDLSDWPELTLDENGYVIELEINNKKLTTIPPEIGQLISLKRLLLINMQIESLPKEIGQLRNLKLLQAQLALSDLPKEIGQLNNLETLYLYGNFLSNLPAEIGQLTNLKSLDLGGNLLTSLPTEIKQLLNLTGLDVSNNKLSKFNHVPFIPSGGNSNILNCSTDTNLKDLRLSGNPNLTAISKCICDLDIENGGAVDIDVVPNGLDCVDSNVIGN